MSAVNLGTGVIVRRSPDIPVIHGVTTTLTCTNDAGNADLIEWLTGSGIVLASAMSVHKLELFMTLESLLLHGENFTCHILRNNRCFTNLLSVNFNGKFNFIIPVLLFIVLVSLLLLKHDISHLIL